MCGPPLIQPTELPYLGNECGGGGGVPKGLVHNPLMHFFTLGSSELEISETYFFDIVTKTITIQPMSSMFEAVSIWFSPYLGIGCGSQGIGTQPA